MSDQKKTGTLRWLTNQELEEVKKEIGRIKFTDSFHEILRILKSAILTTDNQSKQKIISEIAEAFENAPMQKRKIDPNDPKTRFRPVIEESERFIEAMKLEDILETLKLAEKPTSIYPKLEKRQVQPQQETPSSTLYPKLEKRSSAQHAGRSLYPSVPRLSQEALEMPVKEVQANIARMEKETQEKRAQKAIENELRFYKKPVPANRKAAQKRPQFKDPFKKEVEKDIRKPISQPQIPAEFQNRAKKPYGTALPYNMSVPISHKSLLTTALLVFTCSAPAVKPQSIIL